MTNIHVRFAAHNDLAFVSRDEHITTDAVARKIDQQEVILAEIAGEPVGYLRLEYLWSIVPYIALITVEDDHRRNGIGKALLQFTSQYLVQNGHTQLYSSSQADEPEPQAWHRHMGFEDCGLIAGINAGVSEIFFRKQISVERV